MFNCPLFYAEKKFCFYCERAIMSLFTLERKERRKYQLLLQTRLLYIARDREEKRVGNMRTEMREKENFGFHQNLFKTDRFVSKESRSKWQKRINLTENFLLCFYFLLSLLFVLEKVFLCLKIFPLLLLSGDPQLVSRFSHHKCFIL